MSLNDTDVTLGGNKGMSLHPVVANPTASSTHDNPLAANFVRPHLPIPDHLLAVSCSCNDLMQVNDPTTDARGAGAGDNFVGHREARRNFSQSAGVVEGRPGIIETTNIDPLNEDSNKGAYPPLSSSSHPSFS